MNPKQNENEREDREPPQTIRAQNNEGTRPRNPDAQKHSTQTTGEQAGPPPKQQQEHALAGLVKAKEVMED